MTSDYPDTRRGEHTDDYHGARVTDPYRWLEQSAHTPEVRAWIEAQNELTFDYLEGIPAREHVRERLTELWDYPKKGAPFKKGGRYFQFRNSGLQNQNVFYTMDAPQDEGHVLLDPNTLSEDGTAALSMTATSEDGKLLAYAVAQSGSDMVTWRVRDVATGEDLADEVAWSRFAQAAWLPDGSGFFYLRFATPEEGETYISELEHPTIMLHKIGTAQAEDTVVFERPDDAHVTFGPTVSDDGRYLIISIYKGSERTNLVFYCRPLDGDEFAELIPDWEAQYFFLGNDGDAFYFQTNLDADLERVIAIDLAHPAKENWHTVIAEREDTLQGAKLVGDEIVCLYLQDAAHRLERYSLEGEPLGSISLPGLGSVTALHAERDDNELFYSFTSFLHPSTNFRFDLKMNESEQLATPSLDFDPEPYTTRQVFVTSKDGTRVPMFLVHKKNLEINEENPTLLYGYGGFKIPVLPGFSVERLVWLELGGVLAVANLRGGGEYGKAWHEAGTLANKQNVFDDFIACAEYLIDEGVTSPEKLATEGRSNGGLLVGAAMTQRPELFAAALPGVGVLDMLRFHKFTIGWAWVSDYGSADDPEQFETLLAYSPLHALKPGTAYPATLITTGDFDDRVVPAHSFKFAAALQHAQTGDAPTLIRVQTKAGHGMGKPTTMLIEERADILAFLTAALEMED